ncbi:multidrug resistance efflux pump [Vibrio ishigakensis]|uniref:Multidrug resistance efflux pump n=1 Tax=Vibrio ishigakensis TaxID=1481914 RepID=A0A0B8NZ64_9VIBR|nr:multidrug resistance efflux pump [Vibrio ishigakensis]
MSEEKQVPAEETQEAAPETPTPPAKDPVKTLTRNVFIVVAIIFVWYLFADRHTPWTDQARVQAYVIQSCLKLQVTSRSQRYSGSGHRAW